MTPTRRDATKQAQALTRRRLHAKERHERQQKQAQRDIDALHQALKDLGMPDDLVTEIEGRLPAQKKWLGQIFGLMFPPFFGCVNAYALTRTRGWDKHGPLRRRGALPTRSWLKRLRTLAHDILVPLWRHIEPMSDATRRRWQWSWVLDDSVVRTYGTQLELVGTWWSGQHKRVVDGIDGVLLLVGMGDGTLVVPVDFAVRRPNPTGPGRRCRTQLGWAQARLDERLAPLHRRGLNLPAPLVVAESWVSDSKLMAHVADTPQGPFLVQGTAHETSYLEDGRTVKGADVLHDDQQWPWRHSLNAPGCRSARRRATSPTSGEVTVILVDNPGEKRWYLLWCATAIQATRLLRLWARRHWSEQVFRTLKHL